MDDLEPNIFDRDEKLKDNILTRLLTIALEASKLVKINIPINDIVIAGSCAGYNYLPKSDIDLHIITEYKKVGKGDKELGQQLLMAKMSLFNLKRHIFIKGHIIEIYFEDINEPVKSNGIYSLYKNKWIKYPSYKIEEATPEEVKKKTKAVRQWIKAAIKSNKISDLEMARNRLWEMRQLGLFQAGEGSVENLAFKTIRHEGLAGKLIDALMRAEDKELSLENIGN